MLPLYRSIFTRLTGDTQLRDLLGADETDPHVYQTQVQFHSEAALRNQYWVSFNKTQDVGDGSQQTNVIRDIRCEVHVWGRDATSDVVDQIEDRVRALLDNFDLSTNPGDGTGLMAWFCLQDGPSTRSYDIDQKVWHGRALYHCKVADRQELPS